MSGTGLTCALYTVAFGMQSSHPWAGSPVPLTTPEHFSRASEARPTCSRSDVGYGLDLCALHRRLRHAIFASMGRFPGSPDDARALLASLGGTPHLLPI